jgi:hypothetical protein
MLRRLNEPWAIIIAAVIGGVFLLIGVYAEGRRAGQESGEQQAQATATAQQAASAIVAAQQPEPTLVTQIVTITQEIMVTPTLGPSSLPTDIPRTQTPWIVPQTVVVEVTRNVVVTPTTLPTAIPPETTPPGTTLDDGETWKHEKVELTLTSQLTRNTNEILVNVNLKNVSDTPIPVKYSGENFRASSNLDERLEMQGFHECGTIDIMLNPDESTNNTNCPFINYGLRITVDLKNTELTEIFVTVYEPISGISDARWRIPVDFLHP